MTNVSKNKKKKKKKKNFFLLHVDAIVNVRVWVLSNEVEKTSLRVFFNSVYLYDSMFAGIVWINKPHYVMK